LVFGRDIDDQYGQLISDISIKINDSNEKSNKIIKIPLPYDVFIDKMENVKELLEIG
jgi:hypothetical protein